MIHMAVHQARRGRKSFLCIYKITNGMNERKEKIIKNNENIDV